MWPPSHRSARSEELEQRPVHELSLDTFRVPISVCLGCFLQRVRFVDLPQRPTNDLVAIRSVDNLDPGAFGVSFVLGVLIFGALGQAGGTITIEHWTKEPDATLEWVLEGFPLGSDQSGEVIIRYIFDFETHRNWDWP